MNSTFILFATELKSHSFLILFFYFWNLNENYAVPAVYVTPEIKGNFFTILTGWKENRCAFNTQKKIFRNVTCLRFFSFLQRQWKNEYFLSPFTKHLPLHFLIYLFRNEASEADRSSEQDASVSSTPNLSPHSLRLRGNALKRKYDFSWWILCFPQLMKKLIVYFFISIFGSEFIIFKNYLSIS